jgi:hypothetical protein
VSLACIKVLQILPFALPQPFAIKREFEAPTARSRDRPRRQTKPAERPFDGGEL